MEGTIVDLVTPEQCQEIVREKQLSYLGVRRCSLCNCMIGYYFSPPDANGVMGVAFDPSCSCSSRGSGGESREWHDVAHFFNIQTPEVRTRMWQRFNAGKSLCGAD